MSGKNWLALAMVTCTILIIPAASFATPTNYKYVLDNVKNQQYQINQDIQHLDMELNEQFKKIRNKEVQLKELNAMQVVFEEELTETAERIEQRKDFMNKRLVALQVKGQTGYLDVLLGASSLTDFFHRAYAIDTILKADKEMVKTFKKDVNALKELEQLLHEGKTMYEEHVKTLQKLTTSIEQKITEKEHALLQLQEKEHLIKSDYYNSLHQVDTPILEETTFTRPSPGYVSSEFGYRIHPIFKIDNFHKGIDLATSGAGVEVVAVTDGVIEYTGYLGGYGYVVFIGHELEGHHFTTVYAHQQGLEVSIGQEVKQGDFIGYMGNSGNSTGQHLHFEIHVGQWTEGQVNAVNPRVYIDF